MEIKNRKIGPYVSVCGMVYVYSRFHLTANNTKITLPVKIPVIRYISFEPCLIPVKLCLQVLVCLGRLNLSQTTVH